jgi:hypothetical protein
MKPTLILTLLAAGLASCSTTDSPYKPVTRHERIEYRNDRGDIYPEDVRKDLAYYSKVRVAWAGIILSNNSVGDDVDGRIRMDTVFQQHYFDWEQDEHPDGVRLLVSPRGEGNFRMRWHAVRKDPDATEDDAMKYARPGKLALVYGTPESIDADGTIVLRYHYIRILGTGHFSATELTYGRVGESFHPYDEKQ